MIYCVWYPSGGFGHFVNAVLELYGENFKCRDDSKQLNFDATGTSHQYIPTMPKYMWSQGYYDHKFDDNMNYSVLIDNGMRNPDVKWKEFFPGAKIIKICYNDCSWPLIMQTYAIKAMKKSTVDHYQLAAGDRQNYLDLLINSKIRHYYKPDPDCLTLELSDLFEYTAFKNKLESFGIVLSDFEKLWHEWYNANSVYLLPLQQAKQIVADVKSSNLRKVTIENPLTQAITLFYLSLEYPDRVLPDKFFNSIQEIIDWAGKGKTWRAAQLEDRTCDQDQIILDIFDKRPVKYVGDTDEFRYKLNTDPNSNSVILIINHPVWFSDIVKICQQHIADATHEIYISINRYHLLGNDTEHIMNNDSTAGVNILNAIKQYAVPARFELIKQGTYDQDLGRYFNFVQPLTWMYCRASQ